MTNICNTVSTQDTGMVGVMLLLLRLRRKRNFRFSLPFS